MLAIGRALMANQKILLLDEPSLGLAPILRKKIFEKIRDIKKTGVTILLVEQDVASTLKLLDRGYILESGGIVAEGTSDELTKELVRRAYLGV
jgi:branched-chain amino acid transport system ATP-binding protein